MNSRTIKIIFGEVVDGVVAVVVVKVFVVVFVVVDNIHVDHHTII
jgi:hypothetical protein